MGGGNLTPVRDMLPLGDGAKNEGLIGDVKNLTIKETRSAHTKLTH